MAVHLVDMMGEMMAGLRVQMSAAALVDLKAEHLAE
jgi:hypothetical protein